ncbi:MAG TPA: acyltransferase [Rhodopila sp.]|nr:acyltransferase [Rhodopila sp.]
MSGQRHFAVLDGLRGVAALVVLCLHVMQAHHSGLPQAALAVDFFFLLSGFVVAYAYEARLRTTLCFFEFTKIRLLRLYPLIFLGTSVGIVVTAVHARLLGDISATDVVQAGVLGLLLLPGSVFPQWDTAYPMNVPAWSLFFELAINLAYARVVRHLTTLRLVVLTGLGGAILILLALLQGGLQTIGAGKAGFVLGFGRVLFPFAAGVLLYRLRGPVRQAPWLGALLPVGLAALLLAPLPQNPLVDLAYVMVLFPAIVGLGASVTVGGSVARVCLFAGRLSYPVYITHQPFLRLAPLVEARLHLGAVVASVLETGFCLAFAYAALRLFDEPLRAMLGAADRAAPSGWMSGGTVAPPPGPGGPGLP